MFHPNLMIAGLLAMNPMSHYTSWVPLNMQKNPPKYAVNLKSLSFHERHSFKEQYDLSVISSSFSIG